MKRLLVLTCAAISACSSGTQIRVSDENARIYVNGDYVGTGDGYYSDRRPSFTTQQVTLRRDGCVEQSYVMRRNGKPDYGAIVSAAAFAVPIFWVAKYKAEHDYEFECRDLTD